MATVVRPHRRLRQLAGPGAGLGRRVGHGPRRRAGRPRLRHAGRAGLPAERDINLVTATIRQAQSALVFYADPAWAPDGLAHARRHRPRRAGATPSPAAASSWRGPARSPAPPAPTDDLAVLRGWLDGVDVPTGLAIDTDLRWGSCTALIAQRRRRPGARSRPSSTATAPRAASGRRRCARALCRPPSRRPRRGAGSTATTHLPNWLQRSLLQGFQHSAQLRADRAVRCPSSSTSLDQSGRTRDSEPAAGVRRARLPGVPGQRGHGGAHRRLARRARPPGAAAPAGRRGPRRRRPGPEGPGQGRRAA